MNSTDNWYLYIIRTAGNILYTGITTDVERRFQEHTAGKTGAKFLRGKAPLSLEFSAPVGTRSDASKMEIKVKKLPRKVKEQIIIGKKELPSIK